ncbi:MAG TPA: transporter [Bryobacteraceae bacterium]|nr:transporter [Bryobacteraceae bacterium]
MTRKFLPAAVALRGGFSIVLLFFLPAIVRAQELQPRAYLPSPVGLGFLGISYSGNSGGLLFDPSLPIQNGHVDAHIPALALGGTFDVFGRTGQVLGVLPYVVADLSGTFAGVEAARHRSGLSDSTLRFSINLHGAPAMHLREYARYRPKLIVGVSLTATAPIGQYDPNVLVNIGTNRWAVKPEIGIARFFGKWEIEGAFGAWIYMQNSDFFGNGYRTQEPLGSAQAHVVRLLPRRMWLAFDSTFFTGGRTTVNGKLNADYAGNTRIGATYGIGIGRRQSVRIAYFDGVTARVGADSQSLTVAYQVIWHQASR